MQSEARKCPVTTGLPEATIGVIESTVPLVAKAGPTLTCKFYERMLENHPELKDIFNQSHQQSLAQPRALFDSVAGYATNLRDLGPILPTVERIAHKHASLGILPDQYGIVGSNLLKTIEAELGAGQEILDAWGAAYGVLANVFISREEELYKEAEAKEGGWRGLRSFKVKKEKLSDTMIGITFTPVGGGTVSCHKPGQYLSLYIRDPSMEHQQIRQYSIANVPGSSGVLQIAVKRHDKGIVSQYLHDKVTDGDVLQVAPPFGDFHLNIPSPETPVLLMSGGSGVTPMICMLRTLAAQSHKGPVYWINQSHDTKGRAFAAEVLEYKKNALPQLETYTWITDVALTDKIGIDYDFKGHFDLKCICGSDLFKRASDLSCYFTGPMGFMAEAERQLLAGGVPKANLHYECFGPFQTLQA